MTDCSKCRESEQYIELLKEKIEILETKLSEFETSEFEDK